MTEFADNVIPSLEHIPDRQAASALSEAYTRLKDFQAVGLDASDADFPSEPSELSSIQLAYMETQDNAPRVRRQFVTLDQDPHSLRTFLQCYESEMKPFRDVIPDPEHGIPGLTELSDIAPAYSRRVGMRTVANFAVFRSIQNPDRYFSSIMVPRVTVENAPLDMRHMFLGLIGRLGSRTALLDLNEGVADEATLNDTLRAENSAKNAGVLLAAVHLPPVSTVKRMITSQLLTTQMRATPQLNRAQRRAKKR